MRLTLIALTLASLIGCNATHVEPSQPKPQISFNQTLYPTANIDVIDEEALFSLTPEQQASFLIYVDNKLAKGKLKHEAISDFLIERLANFTYFGDTLTASQALAQNQGNCMSLAILTTALAKLVGIEYAYREVITMPVFEKQNNILLSSIHVQTKLFNESTNDMGIPGIVSRPGIVIDYFPEPDNIKSKYLRYPQFLAMYYKNIASGALIANQSDTAFAYAKRAFELDEHNPEILNLMAIIHRRAGDEVTAESIYKTAMSLDDSNISLLSNYIVLLIAQGRKMEAMVLKEQLTQLDDTNPYAWLDLAYIAHQNGELNRAEKFYKKTIFIAPYVRAAHIGLFNIYDAQGREQMAEDALLDALEWANGKKERKQIKYKLYGRNQAIEANVNEE